MISSGFKRGVTHLNYEDQFVVYDSDSYTVIAVFDGCSSSKHGIIASNVMAQILRNILHKRNNKVFTSKVLIELTYLAFGKFVADTFFSTQISGDYRSTIIVACINKENKEANISYFGDGLIFVDSECILNSDTNVTDYVIDHDYNEVVNGIKTIDVSFNENITISTDGLNSFASRESFDKNEIYDLFVKDNKFYHTENFVQRTCNILSNKRSLSNNDDITIVRYESKD